MKGAATPATHEEQWPEIEGRESGKKTGNGGKPYERLNGIETRVDSLYSD